MRFFVGWRLNVFCGVAGLTLGLFAHHIWDEAQAAKALRGQVKEANVQIEREHQSDTATQATGEAVATAVDRVQWRTRTILQEVPVYVTPESDRSAVLPVGFVRLHDAAAAGTTPVPVSAGEPVDAPSGVALSAATGVIVDNYGQCHVWREQLVGWQSWYRDQSALWAGEGSRSASTPRQLP